MPMLSAFYGILIYMYQELGGKHNLPHIHAEYGDDEAVFDLDGNLLEGSLPKKKQKLVEAWIGLHEDDLRANWKLLSAGEGYYKIPPLQ